MAQLIIISWRDIPAQVIAKRGREVSKIQLTDRFQEAVDRAAMRAGKGSSDAYLADWQRSAPVDCSDDLDAAARTAAAEIESRYTDEDLERIIRSKGVDERIQRDAAPEQSEGVN
jgi:Virulence factor